MHTLALLHLLAADVAPAVVHQCPSPPPGITLPEAVMLGLFTVAVSIGAAYGAVRSQVRELERRVGNAETAITSMPTTLATIAENLRGLRRELHASGAFPRVRGGDDE